MHIRPPVNTPIGDGEGYQEFTGAAHYERYGSPGMDVCISRFDPSSHLRGPLGGEHPLLGYNDV